jgi:hypothetical protein
VLIVVLDGSAILSIDDDDQHKLARGEVTLVAKGRRRKITAGRNGVCYLSIHRRRPPLQIGRAAGAKARSPAPSGS